MSMIANAVFAAAALSSLGGMSSTARAAGKAPDATLRFVSANAALAGISFGMNAVDGRSLLLDQRTSTHLAGGRRTIWYSCPNEPMSQGITFDFVPGTRYELACRAGQAAQVRVAEDC
jgi:hypothetical protein